MWEMKKVKQSRKGSKTYSNWMASWREGNKTRNVHLGSTRKMDGEVARRRRWATVRKEIENRACTGIKALGFEGMHFKCDRDRQKWYGPISRKNLEALDRWKEAELSP